MNKGIVFLDTETTGLDLLRDKPFITAVRVHKDVIYYQNGELEKLKTLLSSDSVKEIWGWNIKFDLHMLYNAGVCVNSFIHKVREGMLLKRFCDNLDSFGKLALTKNRETADKLRTVYLEKRKEHRKRIDKELEKYSYSLKEFENDYKKNILNVPKELISFFKDKYYEGNLNYGFEDIDISFIKKYLLQDLDNTYLEVSKRTKNLTQEEHKLIALETETIITLFFQERTGMSIDEKLLLDYLKMYQTELKKSVSDFQQKINLDIKPSNHKKFKNRLQEIFPDYNIKSTDKSFLLSLYKEGNQKYDEIYDVVIKIRNLEKMYNTYLRHIFMASKNGLLYPTFRIAHTKTGRISSPLQQIPRNTSTEKGFCLRNIFNSGDKNFINFYFDYSQIELRITALYSILMKCPSVPLINCFKPFSNNEKWIATDLHLLTAKQAGLSIEYRSVAKTCNFLLLYGGGKEALKKQINNVSLDIVEKLYNSFHKTYPEIKKMNNILISDVYRKGYFENIFNRKYHYKIDWKTNTSKMLNHLVQGTCAYILKSAMVDVFNMLKDKKSKILYNLHDELHIKIHKSELDIVKDIKTHMEKYMYSKTLPLIVDVNYSLSNWGEKKIWKDIQKNNEDLLEKK